MNKRLNAMNCLIKFSKNIIVLLIVPLLFCGTIFAETISGGIRKEYKQPIEKNIKIPYNEPQYSTAAILAYNKGLEEYKLSNYDKAIESFKLAIKQESGFADAYFNLGILYEYFSNFDSALIAFNRAYSINKKDYEALHYVIKCYLLKNDSVAARYYLKKMPKDSEYYQITKELFSKKEAKWKKYIS